MSFSWPWHFVALSDVEKQERRELLDLRGVYAQCSVLVALVLVRVYKMTLGAAPATEKPTERRTRRKNLQRSWLDSPPFAGWMETKRQYIICLIWLGWLLGLSVWNSGEDYLHFTKALAHVSLSQLPLQVLMSPALYMSPSPGSPSVVSVLTSVPQPTINAYHRLFGRLVLAPLLVAHALLYDSFFLQSSHPDFGTLFAKRVQDTDVQWGIAAVTMVFAAVWFARPAAMPRWVRWLKPSSAKTRQQIFYIGHVSIVGVLELAAFSHVSVARVYILESLLSSAINFGCCWLMQ
ncbi:putative metalloreductase Fre8 [Aspergillus ibericus CBS 121593]|uniref:Rerric reductase like transmembrane component n=1 Tax=Aspergillus ibericus CBS 121593 TaxID=1448316 RepID=A0A395H020_9EURO|nr:rerric reductase like transmembrane component [Aspergillus ibericus CBS 121593]RAL00950.1 rerric reductase like transmembrane component [Aspergillus ibericus CBS 121593]